MMKNVECVIVQFDMIVDATVYAPSFCEQPRPTSLQVLLLMLHLVYEYPSVFLETNLVLLTANLETCRLGRSMCMSLSRVGSVVCQEQIWWFAHLNVQCPQDCLTHNHAWSGLEWL